MPIVEGSKNEAYWVSTRSFLSLRSVSDETIVFYFLSLLLDKVYVGLD